MSLEQSKSVVVNMMRLNKHENNLVCIAESDFQTQYQRAIQKQNGGVGNFHLSNHGDLVTNKTPKRRTRLSSKEPGIPGKGAVTGNRYGKTVPNVNTTICKPNERKPRWLPPTAQSLPEGHKVEVLSLPNETVGHIIGAKGRNIERVKKAFGVEAGVSNKASSGSQNIHIWGPFSNVEQAVADIESMKTSVLEAGKRAAEREREKAEKVRQQGISDKTGQETSDVMSGWKSLKKSKDNRKAHKAGKSIKKKAGKLGKEASKAGEGTVRRERCEKESKCVWREIETKVAKDI